MSSSLALIGVCFFLSGLTALVYEVVWLRMLGLVLGYSAYAATVVLTAFMAGLALGSLALGRRAEHLRNPLAVYGWIEVAIGVYCALTPALMELASALYFGIHRALGLQQTGVSLVQFVIAFLLLLVPTTLMGGTLPVLSQALAGHSARPGRTVGALYAINTFGAVAGVAVGAYALIPSLGNRLTIALAAVGNLAVGAVALALSRRSAGIVAARATEPGDPQDDEPDLDPRAVAPWSPLAARVALMALGVSGAAAMVYEVAWTRALALVIGSSTYAFAAMLLAFLSGIAGGSGLYSWLRGRSPADAATLGALQAAAGLAATLSLLLFEWAPAIVVRAIGWSDAPALVELAQILVSAATLLPLTLLLGATLPAAVTIIVQEAQQVGRGIGLAYAVNTLGAILGTVAAGLVLLPTIGAHASLKAAIATNLVLAGVLFATCRGRRMAWRGAAPGVALAAAAAVVLVPHWDQRVMASGAAIRAKEYLAAAGQRRLGDVIRGRDHELLFYRDGLHSTVSVKRSARHLFLQVNGKTDASTSGDMPTQLMLGHLPLLLHPKPAHVLVIGLGIGATASAVIQHPIERLDVAEIEPAVVEASRLFTEANREVLKDPRVRLVVADGRNFLRTSSSRYDVIISEPSNPWISGLAALFSVEFFELARQRLRPDGIMLQWVQGYNLAAEDLKMIVRSFRVAFPATSVWNTLAGDFLLVGRTRPAPLDLGHIPGRYRDSPGLRQDLQRLGILHWPGVLGYFMLGEADTQQFAEGVGLNRDDRLPLEFSAPRALHRDTTERNWRLLRSHRSAELPELTSNTLAELGRPEARYAIGMAYLARRLVEDALPHFERTLELDSRHTLSMLQASAIHLRLGRAGKALELARAVAEREPRNASALYVAGLASARLNDASGAVAYLERAAALDPQNERVRRALTRAQLAELRGTPFGAEEDFLIGLFAR